MTVWCFTDSAVIELLIQITQTNPFALSELKVNDLFSYMSKLSNYVEWKMTSWRNDQNLMIIAMTNGKSDNQRLANRLVDPLQRLDWHIWHDSADLIESQGFKMLPTTPHCLVTCSNPRTTKKI